MRIQPVTQADRSTFVGPKLHDKVKTASKYIMKYPVNLVEQMIRAVVSDVSGDRENAADLFRQLRVETKGMSHLEDVYVGILIIIKASRKLSPNSVKKETLMEDLKELGFCGDVMTLLGTTMCEGPPKKNFRIPQLPTLQSCTWTVDVTISSSSISRILEPVIEMNLTLSDGLVKTFEVPVSRFHTLRYRTATLLKEMEDLEKRSIFKT